LQYNFITNFKWRCLKALFKWLGIDLFSIGEINAEGEGYSTVEKMDGDRYYSFTLKGPNLAGGIVMGDKDFASRLKKAVENGFRVPAGEGLTADGIIGML
jgi:NAD(P)H-nitrite reductase large subunit